MRSNGPKIGPVSAVAIVLALAALAVPAFAQTSWSDPADVDFDGYIGQWDYHFFEFCFFDSGPQNPTVYSDCRDAFDADDDGDLDLRDYSAIEQRFGHLPMPLRDAAGNILTAGSTTPYNGPQTCGVCHPVADRISNGAWFQDGRTNTAGQVDMGDDYDGDGKFWIKSAGRYGKWGQSFQYMLASKANGHPSDMDQTTFVWVRDCSGCHPGGGPGMFDRDDELLYDASTGQFGYEKLGLTSQDVELDGDYSILDYATGTVRPAPWDVTGLSAPDCLLCHRNDRPLVNGADQSHGWRKGVLSKAEKLEDSGGAPVPAFAAAGTAGQGWFSTLDLGATPPVLDIDYGQGVANGSLLEDGDGYLAIAPTSVTFPPKDQACWGCHPYGTISGTTWFDDRDIHYRKFNRLNDADPSNDIPPTESRVCTVCHQGNLDHNIGKGNSFQIHFRNDLDYQNMLTCRNCHLTTLPDGMPNPLKHPDAPDVPGEAFVHNADMFNILSCQFCHIPYTLLGSVVFRDISIASSASAPGAYAPGNTGLTSQYYSADPMDPTNPDKSTWYPSFLYKTDVDGQPRWFPTSVWINIYWADWDDGGTPGDYSDDVFAPIPTWKLGQITNWGPLAGVTNDDGIGGPEINRPEEMLIYMAALKGNDSNGEPVALRPVLVKGKWIWYEDPGSPDGVNAIYTEDAGDTVTWYPYLWSLDHNVLAVEESLGYNEFEPFGCVQCHQAPSGVFDREILVDPFGVDGQPVYQTVRQMTGLNPP
ncbi:MAG: hypothetical protein J5J06_08520 [Phycisphaerae bacterium]|nr:hypothetical protein [Phycisphaerae bacterium]